MTYRNSARYIILILIPIVMLLIAEVFVRLLGYMPNASTSQSHLEGAWAELDSRFGWVNKAGGHPSFEFGQRVMNFAPDHTRRVIGPVKEGAPELLLVGCSYTQGYGLEDQQTFASKLDQQLPGTKVVNFGTGGYGTYQSLLRLRQELNTPRNIRYIVYPFIEPHLTRNVAESSWVLALQLQDGSYFVAPHARRQGDGFKEMSGYAERNWPLEIHSALIHLVHKTLIVLNHRVPQDEQMAVTRALVTEMANLAKSKNIPFLMVGLEYPNDLHVNDIVGKGIHFADCRIPAGLIPELRIGGTGHPNEAATSLWTQCIIKSMHG